MQDRSLKLYRNSTISNLSQMKKIKMQNEEKRWT